MLRYHEHDLRRPIEPELPNPTCARCALPMYAPQATRRDLLTGKAVRAQAEAAQNALAAAVLNGDPTPPMAGPTVRLTVAAMATEFGVLMNPGPAEQVMYASDALDLVGHLERQLTVYDASSELSRLNAAAAAGPIEVEPNLFALLQRCAELTRLTDGAFDAATQAQIALWHRCRAEDRVPTEAEIAAALGCSGMRHVLFDTEQQTIAFDREGIGFNLGAIGKGYALDLAAEVLVDAGVRQFCLHGGRSSVTARGGHNGADGWPVGIGNPLFTGKRLGTVLLRDRALGTSGSNIQFFRHNGQRYGHILDPRTARPAGELLSVTVLAPDAATADALATAFFVLGVEKSRQLCDNDPLIGALLIPPPRRGGRLEPICCGIPEDCLFFDAEQVL